jgi:hypothetical protein
VDALAASVRRAAGLLPVADVAASGAPTEFVDAYKAREEQFGALLQVLKVAVESPADAIAAVEASHHRT